MRFGERLKQRREAAGMRRETLAHLTGCTVSMIYQWEALVEPPDSVQRAVRVAKELGLSMDELVGLEKPVRGKRPAGAAA